jgi:Family of unknown function (DUF6152)
LGQHHCLWPLDRLPLIVHFFKKGNVMQRRPFIAALGALTALYATHAHHGWSSFDQDRPIYLEGTARKVSWQNPHVEIDIDLPAHPRAGMGYS